MRIAVAVLAGGGLVAALMQGDAMGTLKIDFGLDIMTFRAIHLFKRGIMQGILHVVVAAGALVVGVNGLQEPDAVHRTVGILLAMAFEACGIVELRMDKGGRCKQPQGGTKSVDVYGYGFHIQHGILGPSENAIKKPYSKNAYINTALVVEYRRRPRDAPPSGGAYL